MFSHFKSLRNRLYRSQSPSALAPVYDAVFVAVLNGEHRLPEYATGFIFRQVSAIVDVVEKVAALGDVHDEVYLLLGFKNFV